MPNVVRAVPNGTRIARLFRKVRGFADVRTCDLERVLAEDGIEVVESECSNPGYAACLVTVGEGMPAGILLAPGQSRGRRRFSIAHELGHFHIPTHRKHANRPCGDKDLSASTAGDDDLEVEANDFAVEILMPRAPFLADSARMAPCIESVINLAADDMYDVSVTAAALRYVRLSSEACAVVCSRDGRVDWVIRSDSFFYRIPSRGDALPMQSLARFAHNGESPTHGAHPLDPYTWFALEQRGNPELFESTHAIPSQRQVLSMLWAVADR